MKLSDYIVSFLEKKGIHDFFGYQGTMIAHFVDSIEKNPNTRNHSCYNEQGAAFAACGYAQTTKSCACAYATSGPGAANLLSGVAEAYFDSLPVIFFTGQLNTYEYTGIPGIRQHGFQEMDVVSMAKPVTKYAVQITDEKDIVKELNKAYHIATTGRMGPVLLDLPMNIQRGQVNAPVYEMEFEDIERDESEEAVKAIEEALAQARRPVILLGNGVRQKDVSLLLEKFAGPLKIPVVTSVLAKSELAFEHPLNFGCIGSAYGHRYANMIVNAKSDLLLCFGISLCPRQTGVNTAGFAQHAKIVRVDIDEVNLKRRIHEETSMELSFVADAGKVIEALVKEPPVENAFSKWREVCKEIKHTLQDVDNHMKELYPNRLLGVVSEALKGTDVVSVDVGQHMIWTYQAFKNREGQKLLFSGGHGAMGYALPAAIGAYYATGKPVACICGDGALQMNIQELQWVKRENIPVQILVLNNQALGLIRQQQKDYFDGVFAGASEEGGFTSCPFAEVAKGYGIAAFKVAYEDAAEKLPKLLGEEGPLLVEILLENGTYAYPKTCLGEPIHNQRPYMDREVYEKMLQL
jgi:acetolactate synthase-1/2/3 large subunit